MNGLEWFQGRHCGVTGAGGYIGSRLVQMLRQAGAIVEPSPENEVCFHLAAQTSAKKADEDPAEDWAVNVGGMYALIDEWRHEERKPFIVFASSATVVGSREMASPEPLTIYDLHKLAAEQALEHACRRGWARGTSLRLANVYGPSPAESGPDRGVLNRWILGATVGAYIELWGSGDWRRDYVFIDDVCRAFMLAAANQEATNGRHFQVGTGELWTVRQTAETVATVAQGRGIEAHVVQTEPPRPLPGLDTRDATMDPRPLAIATGWGSSPPLTSPPDGIARTLAYYLEKRP